MRPLPTDHAPYHNHYVSLVPEDDILPVLRSQKDQIADLLGPIPEELSTVRHAPYTWSTREVLGHMIDTERVFGYRAMRFARGDQTELASFDENAYVEAAGFDRIPLADLAEEFASLRTSHILFFQGLSDDAWTRRGVANGAEISVKAMAYILAGHARHHTNILRQRFHLPL